MPVVSRRVLFAVALLAALPVGLLQAQSGQRQAVLLLHSYHRGYEWDDAINRGILEGLAQLPHLDIHIEYLDAIRLPGPEHRQAMIPVLSNRHRQYQFHLVIASDDPAMNFLNANPNLFSGVPVVFCGVNNFEPAAFPAISRKTGVNEAISVHETVAVARTLRPQARKLVGVTDAGLTGNANRTAFLAAAADWQSDIDVIDAHGLEADELPALLSSLSVDDIVLYMGWLSTPSGRRFSVADSVATVRAAGPAPVFGMWDFLLPFGVIGGHVVDGHAQGEAAAALALRVLEGQAVETIPVVMTSPNRYRFNDQELARFGIDADILPIGAQLQSLRPERISAAWEAGRSFGDFDRDLFENHTSVMLLIDPGSSRIVAANRAARLYYGYPQLVGMDIGHLNTLSAAEIQEQMAAVENRTRTHFQFRHRLVDGQIRDVQVFAGPARYNGGNLLFAIVHDNTESLAAERLAARQQQQLWRTGIVVAALLLMLCIGLGVTLATRRKNAALLKEQALEIKRRNRLFSTLLEHLPVGVFMVEVPGGKAVLANAEAMKLLGRGIVPDTNTENLSTVYEAWKSDGSGPYPPEEMPIVRGMAGETSTVDDMLVMRPDGSQTLLEISGTPVLDEHGQVVMSLVNFQDISKRKAMETALRDSNNKLTALFSSMTELVVLHEVVLGPSGEAIDYRILDCNKAFTDSTGIDREAAVGQLASQLYGTDEAPYLKEFTEVGLSGRPLHFETWFAPLEKHFSISVVSPSHGEFATVTTDITEIKRIQQQISAKNKELEQLVFVASHDLRSPLVNVDGYSRELEFAIQDLEALLLPHIAETSPAAAGGAGLHDPALATGLQTSLAECRDAVRHIRGSAMQMDALLKGLLKLSRSGRAALTITDIDMNALAAGCLSSFEFQIKESGTSLILEDLPPCRGDSVQICQIFSNLVNNALKYRDTDRRSVIRLSGELQNDRAVYRVQDNGIGIAREHQENIFELFHRLDPGRTEGEGLGLTIVRQIVDRMNGTIRVESDPGQGSTFIIDLPAARSPWRDSGSKEFP